MLLHPGNYIGDSWYYVEQEIIHCFYLTCPQTIERHTAWDIGHATSTDLVNWQIRELAVKKGNPGAYDGICPATGSVIRFQDHYWMAYTGNWNGPVPSVALAVSKDLYRWEKCAWNPVTRLEPKYYETRGTEPRNWPHWRDPFVFAHDGYVYHYVCARRKSGAPNTRGTLGLARTPNMREWEVLPPPVVDPLVGELEVPQVYQSGKRCYLLFSTLPELLSEELLARCPQTELPPTSYVMVGPSPLGPFTLHGSGRILPPQHPVQPYANQLVTWQDQPYLIGTVWNDKQDYICDPIPVHFTETGVTVKV
jgi:beta-fructofuranosidase